MWTVTGLCMKATPASILAPLERSCGPVILRAWQAIALFRSVHGRQCSLFMAFAEVWGLVARQAPSLAMLLIKTVGPGTVAGTTEEYRFFSGERFRELCWDSLAGFVDGSLPGALGDYPEAIETGEDRVCGMPLGSPCRGATAGMCLLFMYN